MLREIDTTFRRSFGESTFEMSSPFVVVEALSESVAALALVGEATIRRLC
jgi:hypothetical protein